MKNIVQWLAFLWLVLFGTAVFAQEKTVTGIVTDESKAPLPGVSVVVKGTTRGVSTDFDGKYTLQAQADEILEFSSIGFLTQSKKVVGGGKAVTINVVLKEETQQLTEVVVTALGIKREEKALSYNVQQVKAEELTKVKSPNFVNSLNGKVAGITINKSASGVGGATRVVMRGEKSIEGSNNVLYVVDGIPLFNTKIGDDSGAIGGKRVSSEGIADFNPEDIESISVLSGPSAAALYGSNAANGVILINTKKGKEGKMQIAVSTTSEFSRPFILPKFQNTYGNRSGEFSSWGSKLETPSSYDPAKDFFQTGTNFINSLTLTSGNKFNQTFFSAASTDARGIVPNNSYNRYNFTVRNTTSLFEDKVQLDLNASYVKQKDMNMVSQGEYFNPIVAAYLYPRGENFDKIKTFERYDQDRNFPTQYWPISENKYGNQNPYWTAYRNLASNNKDRFMFSAGATYKVTPWANVAARARLDKSYINFERKLYASTNNIFAKPNGVYDYTNYRDHQFYTDVIGTINKQLFDDWTLALNVGSSYSDYEAIERGYGGNLKISNLFAIQNVIPSDGKITEEHGGSRHRNVAIFGNAEIGFKRCAYLTLSGRNEWDSRLVNSAEESFFYPSIGMSAVVSEMGEMPSFINYFKVRSSYTEVASPIAWSGRTPGTITQKIKGGVIQPEEVYPYADFKAERTKSYELGLSLRLFKHFNVESTWYRSNTYNQTFIANLPSGTGYKYIYLQAGDVQNSGIELNVGYRNTIGKVDVNSTVSYSRNKNVIKKMVKDYKHPFSAQTFNIDEVSKEAGRTILKVGGSISDVYASKFLKKDNQGFINIPESGDLNLEDTEPVYLGRVTPDFMLGWNNSFGYKGFGLSFLISGRFGGIVTSGTEAILDKFGVSEASALARDNGGVALPGQGRYNARKYYELIGTGENKLAGYYTYEATNVRLQELSVSYTFPKKWFKDKIDGLTVSVIGNNLWMIYNKAPFDPELTPSTATYGQGNDYFMQPSLRSVGFNVKVKL